MIRGNLRLWGLSHAIASGLGLMLWGCGQDTTAASLRALDVSGEVSVLCLSRDENGRFAQGADRFECPDIASGGNNPNQKRLHALVTQPISGEVALVDLAVSPSSAVIDFEPSQPGFSFMPVGAEPGAIVSTPGGVASFVGVREAGREGIFALPSSCIAPRPDAAPLRDIRTWPACRLPAAPGPMILLEDPFIDHDGDPATPAVGRAQCDGDYVDPGSMVGTAPAATREECPADLATETRPRGRQKVAVALPTLSEIWILDAQEILDRPLGSFDACAVEYRLGLEATLPTSAQRLPPELVTSSASCMPVGYEHGPVPDTFRTAPSDFALDDEGRLFVADTEAPTVHVLDANNPCTLSALPPLEPLSYTDPGSVITTRRVAVSPLTPLGRRYVYAIDNSKTRTAGSLMVFDVSPGSTERTPIVRERSVFNPSEPPDRIVLARDVADVEFAFQDFPQPDNGVAVEGVACDPHPDLPPDDPATLYRPRADSSVGARARTLRGTFAFAALHSGQVGIIDVEDLDAACRRPISVEHGPEENIFGCSNDDPSVPEGSGYAPGGFSTVSGELSCNVVIPHRQRSRAFFTNAAGTARSAGLLAFPTLTLDTGRSVTTDLSEEGREQPKLLAARHFTGQEEALYVGPLVYGTYNPSDAVEDPTNRVDVDPALAERSSLLLSYEEPRAYIQNEDFIATYEGVVRAAAEASFRVDDGEEGYGAVEEGLNASFCVAGIQDAALTRSVGAELGVTGEGNLNEFVRTHADYVQITGALLDADDDYWRTGDGAECGSELFESEGGGNLRGHTLCEQFFGPPEAPTEYRDLRIVEASEDRLLVEPRRLSDPARISSTFRRQLSSFTACCFPRPTVFQVRAGQQWMVRGSATGAPHHVSADPATGRCVNDCNPLVQKQVSRVFELSCSDCDSSPRSAPVGAASDTDFVCVVDAATLENGIDPGERGAECVFQNLTTRFALYRGLSPSRRDMRFRWQLSDGFTPLSLALTSNVDPSSRFSSPRSMLLIPEINQIVISDGTARGIVFITPGNLSRLDSIF